MNFLQPMRFKYPRIIFLLAVLNFFVFSCSSNGFNAENALSHIETQVSVGPRIPGSTGSEEFQMILSSHLTNLGWDVERQDFSYKNTVGTNIIAKNSANPPSTIIGTHYDTRAISDNDPDENLQSVPVPGANDGASGTAVLMELSRLLSNDQESIWLVFFDAEDQGHLNGWDWSVGADYFADHLSTPPEEVIIIDMIGDIDLNIHYEANSSPVMSENIWEIAHDLGYGEAFIKEVKYSIMDDHIPFIHRGIPAILIIDLDYEKWHTTQDDLDHISKESLQKVGEVLLTYLNKD